MQGHNTTDRETGADLDTAQRHRKMMPSRLGREYSHRGCYTQRDEGAPGSARPATHA